MKNTTLFLILSATIIPIILIVFIFMKTSSTQKDATPPPAKLDTTTIQATIKTTAGDMVVELYPELTPETVKNFVTFAKEQKYNDVPFHRVIEGFMIQTGDFENQNGTGGHSYQGPNTTIPDEFHPELVHRKGTLAMANRGPNTGGSQFYIVHAEHTDWLDQKHSVFGNLIDGFPVLDKIATTPTGLNDLPLEEIKILEIIVQD